MVSPAAGVSPTSVDARGLRRTLAIPFAVMTSARARRSRWLASVLFSAAASAITLTPAPAAACGACACFVPYGVRPGNLRDGAPLNMRFLVALDGLDAGGQPETIDPADITWTDADGNTIDFDIEETDGTGNEVWLVPTENLPPNTEFEINVIDSNGASTTMFGTGDLVDLTPLTESGLTAEPIDAPSSACGTFAGARLTWTAIEDDFEPVHYDPVVRLDVTLGEESVTLYTSAAEMHPGRGLELAAPTSDESTTCWGPIALPFGSPGDTLTALATLYDAAGNPLELEPIDVTLGDSPGATCEGMDGGSTDGSDGDGQRGGGMCSVGAPGFGGLGMAWAWILVGIGVVARRGRAGSSGQAFGSSRCGQAEEEQQGDGELPQDRIVRRLGEWEALSWGSKCVKVEPALRQ